MMNNRISEHSSGLGNLTAILAGVAGFAGSIKNLAGIITGVASNAPERFIWWGTCFVLFMLACFLHRPKSQKNVPVPRQPAWHWLGPAFLTLAFLGCDVYIYLHDPPATVELLTEDELPVMKLVIAEAVTFIEQAEDVKLTYDFFPSFRSPLVGPLQNLKYVSQPTKSDEISEDFANDLKHTYVNEHCSFEIVKNTNLNEVFITDVEILVHNFTPLPVLVEPGGMAGDGDTDVDVLLFQLEPLPESDFPWKAKLEWHLNSTNEMKAERWAQNKAPGIKNNFSRIFLAKLFTKVPGIYEYSLTVWLREPGGTARPIEVIPENEPRNAIFTHVENVDHWDPAMLAKYGYKEITETYEYQNVRVVPNE